MLITVHVNSRSKKPGIAKQLDDSTFIINVKSPPEKGKANREVLEILAEELKIPKTSLKIVRGLTTKMKQIEII